MKISFSEESWTDYLNWEPTSHQIFSKINLLIKEIIRQPYKGIGKPEPLKHEFQGYCSRRINDEHRLIYRYTKEEIFIYSCRYHY